MKLVLFLIVICLIQGFSAKIDGNSQNQKKHSEMVEAVESFMKSIFDCDWQCWLNWGLDKACDFAYPDDWEECFECSKGT